ncbi:spore cortex-lytic enzyme [alpha proteobacterium Q-1]|nr:cell wall hydrolase [Iodidimonas nitroreducens]GAK32184.1 spore cortex-lytic enzyme [alpha proteobacterium Q-1]
MSRFALLAGLSALFLPALLPAPAQKAPMRAAPIVADRASERPVIPQNLEDALQYVEARMPAEFEDDARCLAQAIYFEARSEPVKGQLAVAQVVLNRVSSPLWPQSICAVVFQNEHRRHACQFSFACDGRSDNPRNPLAWQKSKLVALVALEQIWDDISDQATHYHADYVSPSWNKSMRQTARYGRHLFYLDARQATLISDHAHGDG